MSEIPVDRAIPIPTNSTRKYPFKQMAVGDSFFTEEPIPNIRACIQYHQKSGLKFTSRIVTEKGAKGIRIWRTA